MRPRSDQHEQAVGCESLLLAGRGLAEHELLEPPVSFAAEDGGAEPHLYVGRGLELSIRYNITPLPLHIAVLAGRNSGQTGVQNCRRDLEAFGAQCLGLSLELPQ